MRLTLEEQVMSEIKDMPESKIQNLINYIIFLKNEDYIKKPNAITEKTFKDSDQGKNIKSHTSLNEYFEKMD